MEELILILSAIPYGVEAMIGLGTVTAVMSVISPVASKVVKLTSWKWDNNALAWIKTNPIMRKLGFIGRQLKRFSLI